MQFESVVTNSTLTFSDNAFLEIDRHIRQFAGTSQNWAVPITTDVGQLGQSAGQFHHRELERRYRQPLCNMGVGRQHLVGEPR